MNISIGAVLADDALYVPLPPPPGGLLTLVHLIGWATCAGCVVGFVIAAAAAMTAMAWKHHCGEDAAAVTPSGDEASASPAPLGVVVLGYAVVGAAGAPVGSVV